MRKWLIAVLFWVCAIPAVASRSAEQIEKEIKEYLHQHAPKSQLSAERVTYYAIKHDIDPILILAQGHIESHFGTKGSAKRTYSVWNVGAYETRSTTQISRSVGYKNVNESIEPYCLLLKKQYLKGKTVKQLMNNFVNKSGKRYASSPNYEKQLQAKYAYIKKKTKLYNLWYRT